MKRIILTTLALALAFTLYACNGGSSSKTPAPSNSAQVPTGTPTQEQDGQGDVIDETIPEGADVIRQGVYYYELVEMSGDYGDGLSPRDGALLTDELLVSIGLYSDNGIPAGQCVYISLDELAILDSAMGRECYLYSVGLGTAEGGLMGDDYQVIYRISVDYSGNKTASIYDDFSSEYDGDGRGDITTDESGDGRGDSITDSTGDGRGDLSGSDQGDGELIAWSGTYVSSGYSIDITEVDISQFYYVIRMITTTQNTIVVEGWATIDGTGYFATSGDMGFSLYDDLSAIDLFASEGSEWEDLHGQYERID